MYRECVPEISKNAGAGKKRQHQVECYKNKMMAQAWPKLQNGRLTFDLDRLGC